MQFVDTNVLLYAISRDPAEQDKAKRANDILADRDLALSVQVLQEFYVQATRASRPDPVTHQQAVRLIESFRRFPVQDLTSAILMAALAARQRFQLSYWDSAIIEAIPRDGLLRSPVRRPGRRPGLRRNPGHQSVPLVLRTCVINACTMASSYMTICQSGPSLLMRGLADINGSREYAAPVRVGPAARRA